MEISSPSSGLPAGGVRRRPVWPAWVIVGVSAAAVLYFQAVGVVDHGTSNLLTAAAIALGLVLLAVWTAYFSPLSRSARWSCIGGAVAVLFLLKWMVKVEGFTGNLRPIVRWPWESN